MMASAIDPMQCFPGLCSMLPSVVGLNMDDVEEDVAAEQETLIKPSGTKELSDGITQPVATTTSTSGSVNAPDLAKLQMTLIEASKGVMEGTDAEYKRCVYSCSSCVNHLHSPQVDECMCCLSHWFWSSRDK